MIVIDSNTKTKGVLQSLLYHWHLAISLTRNWHRIRTKSLLLKREPKLMKEQIGI